MRQKELLVLVIVIFLTIIAWMISDIYLLQHKQVIEKSIPTVQIADIKIDDTVFTVLKEKGP